jgi:hypothetical protein
VQFLGALAILAGGEELRARYCRTGDADGRRHNPDRRRLVHKSGAWGSDADLVGQRVIDGAGRTERKGAKDRGAGADGLSKWPNRAVPTRTSGSRNGTALRESMFTITKQSSFSTSLVLDHLLEGHPCARLHGHNYIVGNRVPQHLE